MSNETYLWILGITIFGYILPIIILSRYFQDEEERDDGEGIIKGFISFTPVVNFIMCIVLGLHLIGKYLWKNKQE